MKHLVLEDELKRCAGKRRIVEMIVCAVFLAIAICFTVLYEQSKVVEELDYFFGKYQQVSYNRDFLWGILVGWLGFFPSLILWICDVLLTKIVTIPIGEDYLTFYRGMLHINLYVNGEYKDGLVFSGYYLETSLPDGTKVNVALGKWNAHFTFSNGHPSIDI